MIAVGSRPADNFGTADLPSYVRADAALFYRRWKHLDLALNFRNLFDQEYFESSNFGDADAGISFGAPFSVFGTVTARY